MPENLRHDITMLQIENATNKANLQNLAVDVGRLTAALRENSLVTASLKQTIDTSRGALYIISGVSGVLGAAVSSLTHIFWSKTL